MLVFNTGLTDRPGFSALQDFARNVVGLLTFGDDLPSRPDYNMHFATIVSVNHLGATVVNGARRMSRHSDVIAAINSLSNSPVELLGAGLEDVDTAALGGVINGIHTAEWGQANGSANAEVVEVAVVYLSPVGGIAPDTCHNFGCGDRTVGAEIGAEISCDCAGSSGDAELCDDYDSTCVDAAPMLDVDEFSCNTEAQRTLDHFRIRYPRRRVDPEIPRAMQCYMCADGTSSDQCAQVCLTHNSSACTMFQLHDASVNNSRPRELGEQDDSCPFSECASPEYTGSHGVRICETFGRVVGTEQLEHVERDQDDDDRAPRVYGNEETDGNDETDGMGVFGRTNFCGDRSSFHPWGEGECNDAARGPLDHYQQQLGLAVQAAFGIPRDDASQGRGMIVRRNVTTVFDCAIACGQARDDGTGDGVHSWCQMFEFSNAGSTCRLWNDVPDIINGILSFTEQDPRSSIFVRTSFCDEEAYAIDRAASHYGARAVLAVPLINGTEVIPPARPPACTRVRAHTHMPARSQPPSPHNTSIHPLRKTVP